MSARRADYRAEWSLSLSSVGWRKFARDLLRLDDDKHLVLPMESKRSRVETAAPR